ncbi:hypothetical protein CS006_10550 [Bifidobacterium primatium]|uniref:Uncharacterized protein n=1 Tax=Bifidobacterium primatium TaxID=2045438 RepID=A0A2M9H6F8_9BIFI|nr:hypothetical protein [Bifidobacterium primatium]PJM72367.1 hypothetical protein CS006_10550 [Bifidobacterium primatium]
MSGQIQRVNDGLRYVMDDWSSVAAYRRHEAESGGYPFVAGLQVKQLIPSTDPNLADDMVTITLDHLTKTDLRNLMTIITGLIAGKEKEPES